MSTNGGPFSSNLQETILKLLQTNIVDVTLRHLNFYLSQLPFINIIIFPTYINNKFLFTISLFPSFFFLQDWDLVWDHLSLITQ